MHVEVYTLPRSYEKIILLTIILLTAILGSIWIAMSFTIAEMFGPEFGILNFWISAVSLGAATAALDKKL